MSTAPSSACPPRRYLLGSALLVLVAAVIGPPACKQAPKAGDAESPPELATNEPRTEPTQAAPAPVPTPPRVNNPFLRLDPQPSPAPPPPLETPTLPAPP